MSRKPNSTCAICGNPYYCCNDSMSARAFTSYKKIVDTPEHYKIFLVLRDYTNKSISKDEAYERLSKLDLKDKGSFREDIQNAIDEIISAKESQENKKQQSRKKTETQADNACKKIMNS